MRWNRWLCPGLCLWNIGDVGCEVEPLVMSWALPMARCICWLCPRFCLWNVGDVVCEVEPLVVSWAVPMARWRCWLCPRFCLRNVGDWRPSRVDDFEQKWSPDIQDKFMIISFKSLFFH